LEPRIELAHNYGMNLRQINAAHRLVEKHANEIRKVWETHFGR
jgi:hypothetical protein